MKDSKTLVIFFAISALAVVFLLIEMANRSAVHTPVEFSAGLVLLPKGAEPLSGKIFVKGEKVRQETSGSGGIQVMIFRPDIKVTWMLTGAGGTCLQMPYQASDNEFEEWKAIKSTNPRFLGRETVSGMECSKYQGQENGFESVYWVSERFSFPVKVDSQDETVEYTNIKPCKLADSLFEIPPACQKAIFEVAPPEESKEW